MKDNECICDGCEKRFVCWTTKRVFSDPTHQALYESYIAEKYSHEDAVKEVEGVIQRAIMKAAIREAANNSPPLDLDTIKKWDIDSPEYWSDISKLEESKKEYLRTRKYIA